MQLRLIKKEMRAVNDLKEKLVAPSVLVQPPANRQHIIGTDVWDTHVRCVLFHKQKDKVRKPTVY